MSKKHDENKDVRLLSRITSINVANKTIAAPKNAIIGIRSWGRIDYLIHYCGYTFLWNNNAIINRIKDTDNNENKKDKLPRKKLKKPQNEDKAISKRKR